MSDERRAPRLDEATAASLLAFLGLAGELKTVRRQGWVDRGVPRAESVAEHSYRAALMGLVLGELAGLDGVRLAAILLIHDLPEARAGDLTPYRNLLADGLALNEALTRWRELAVPERLADDRRDKLRREATAMAEAVQDLPQALAERLTQLWAEYAERSTPEGRFAVQIDKIEALLQAVEYQRAGHAADVNNFLRTAREEVSDPLLVELVACVEGLIHGGSTE